MFCYQSRVYIALPAEDKCNIIGELENEKVADLTLGNEEEADEDE